MREGLKQIEGVRGVFRATFVRYGTKSAYRGLPPTTILLRDVTDTAGAVVADHLWLVEGVQYKALTPLREGDMVEFRGRVTQYEKGYKGRDWERQADSPLKTDYRLSNPTNVVCVARAERQWPRIEVAS